MYIDCFIHKFYRFCRLNILNSKMPPPPLPPPRRGELRRPLPPPKPPNPEGTEIRVQENDVPAKCQICLKFNVDGKCINCNKFICGHCMLIHKQMPELQSHNVIEITPTRSGDEPSISSLNIKCAKHNDAAVSYWCQHCDAPLCNECGFRNYHRGYNHSCVNILSNEALPFLRGICFEKVKNFLEPKDRVKQRADELATKSKLLEQYLLKNRSEKRKQLVEVVSKFDTQDEQRMKYALSEFNKETISPLSDKLKKLHVNLDKGVSDLTSAATTSDISIIVEALSKHSMELTEIEPLLTHASSVIKKIDKSDITDEKFVKINQDIKFNLSETFVCPASKDPIPNYPLQWACEPKTTIDLSHLFDSYSFIFLNSIYDGGLMFVCSSGGMYGKINLNGKVTAMGLEVSLLRNAKVFYLFDNIFACIIGQTVKFTTEGNGYLYRTLEMPATDGEFAIRAACGLPEKIVIFILVNEKTCETKIEVLHWSNRKERKYTSSYETLVKCGKYGTLLLQPGPNQTLFCSSVSESPIYKYDIVGNLLCTYDIDASNEKNERPKTFCADPNGHVYALYSESLVCFSSDGAIIRRSNLEVPFEYHGFHNVILSGDSIIIVASDEDTYSGPYTLFIF